jgi:hypothetical protein
MTTHRRYGLLLAAASVVFLVAAAGATLTFDFAKFDESQWAPAHEDRFPTAGTFVQQEGCVINGFPEGTSKEDLLGCKNGVGYAMRLVKDVEVKDGHAELELELFDGAAPSIAFRVQMADGQVHGPLYNLVIFNQNTPERDYQGVNLWKWGVSANPKASKWQRLAYWNVPIPREKKIKLGVTFQGELIRVFVDGKEIGGMRDSAALGAGKIGVVAIEGPSKFYSFTVTPEN